MQTLELTGSFVIGGLLLLLISSLFFYYLDFSSAKRINEITTTTTIELQEVLDYDFSKIGYRVAGADPVSSISSSSITFNADLDNNGVVDVISYNFQNGLTRTVSPANIQYTVPYIAEFKIICYDTSNAETDIAANVKSVFVRIKFNSQDLISDSTFFATSYFEETYFIKN